MEEKIETTKLSRRGFLRAATGGALALTTGNLLSGCGTGASGTPPGVTSNSRLYVSTFLASTVERFNAVTGAHEVSISTGVSPSLDPPGSGAAGLARGPNNTFWVANRFQDSVEQWDMNTNTRLRVLENLSAPHSVAVGTNGVLYTPRAPSYYNGTQGFSFGGDTIEHFDASTGRYLGTFAQMNMPFSLVWGPDNNLYASSALNLSLTPPNSDSIRRFNSATGALLGTVVQGDKVPFDMVFTGRGTILVSEFLNNRVQEYDLSTGASVRTFATVAFPIGLAFGPDGDLYVGSNTNPLGPLATPPTTNTGTVVRLDAQTGAFKQNFISDMTYAAFLLFV